LAAAEPELIPVEIGLAEALAVLGKLAAVVFVLGCIYVVHGFVIALFGFADRAVGWIPWFGHVATAPLHKIEQKVIHELAKAEQSIDSYVGHSWHQLARLVRKVAVEFYGLAGELLHIVAFLDRLWGPATILRVLRAALHPIRALQHVEHAALVRLHGAEAWLRRMVVEGVLPRIGRIEHELDHVLEHDIATLRARTRTLEQEALREFRWLRSKPWLIVSAAFVGAVAIALRRLGLGWLRCNNVRKTGRFLCGLPVNLLEDILGLALGFLVVIDPVLIAKAAIETEDLMDGLVRKIAALNPEAGSRSQERFAALAASTGDTSAALG
jgi:hypothetical protein